MRRKCYLKTIRTCPHRLRFVKSKIKNVQADENLFFKDTYDIALTKLEPVIYSGMHHKLLGKIGKFI